MDIRIPRKKVLIKLMNSRLFQYRNAILLTEEFPAMKIRQSQSCLPFHKIMGTGDMICVYNLNFVCTIFLILWKLHNVCTIFLMSWKLHNTLKSYIIFFSYTMSEYENLSTNYHKTVYILQKSFWHPIISGKIWNSIENLNSILCVQMPLYGVQISYCHFCVQNTENVYK